MDATIMTWILDYVSRRRMDKLLSSEGGRAPVSHNCEKNHLRVAHSQNCQRMVCKGLPKWQ